MECGGIKRQVNTIAVSRTRGDAFLALTYTLTLNGCVTLRKTPGYPVEM